MIALAFLFALIIGLLWIIVYLLEKYFDMHGSLHISKRNEQAELQNRLDMHKNRMKNSEVEKQIDAIIDRRLSELEQKFPDAEIQEGLTEQAPEVLIIRFKRMFYSTLNLLKTEHNDTSRR